MTLDLTLLNQRMWEHRKHRKQAAARAGLMGALARLAPSVRQLTISDRLAASTGLSLEQLLAPLAPHVHCLRLYDVDLLSVLHALGSCGNASGGNAGGGNRGQPPWPALERASIFGFSPWLEYVPKQVAALAKALRALPSLTPKITELQCGEWLHPLAGCWPPAYVLHNHVHIL